MLSSSRPWDDETCPPAVLVPEYDEAIAFFRDGLGFSLIEDITMGVTKRWVVVGGETGGSMLLAWATNERQREAVGDQFGGFVGLFVYTDDFSSRRAALEQAGAVFEEEARSEAFGIVAVFRNPWGNRWDLIQPA